MRKFRLRIAVSGTGSPHLPFWILVIALCFAVSPAFPGQRKALATETIPLPHLRQPVEILIDHWGVPHIYAKNEADLFFAQSFNVARDRLFQIDLWYRRGLGQLAEVFGPAYVEEDKATRLLLYRGDMKKEWEVYGPGTEEMFQQFTAGINAYVDWIDAHPDRIPFEYKFLRYKPTHWTAEDAVRVAEGLKRRWIASEAVEEYLKASRFRFDEPERQRDPRQVALF